METNREVTYRKVPSLDFLYEISEDGKHLRNIKSKKYHRSYKDKDGYYYYHIPFKGEYVFRKAHRLVAECWMGPCPKGYEVDHFDHNRSNNHYSNLSYVTHQQNSQHRDHANMSKANVLRLGNPVKINDKQFASFTEAAKYLSELTGTPANTIRHYLKVRRSYIHGYKVSYCRDCIL